MNFSQWICVTEIIFHRPCCSVLCTFCFIFLCFVSTFKTKTCIFFTAYLMHVYVFFRCECIYSNKSSHRTPLRLPSLGLYLRATTKKNLLEYNRKIISTYYDIIGHIIRLMKKTCEMKKVALVHLVGSMCAFPCNITLFFLCQVINSNKN